MDRNCNLGKRNNGRLENDNASVRVDNETQCDIEERKKVVVILYNILESSGSRQVHFERLVNLGCEADVLPRTYFRHYSVESLRRFFLNLPEYFTIQLNGYVSLVEPDTSSVRNPLKRSKIEEAKEDRKAFFDGNSITVVVGTDRSNEKCSPEKVVQVMCKILESCGDKSVNFRRLIRLASEADIDVQEFFSNQSVSTQCNFFRDYANNFNLHGNGFVRLAGCGSPTLPRPTGNPPVPQKAPVKNKMTFPEKSHLECDNVIPSNLDALMQKIELFRLENYPCGVTSYNRPKKIDCINAVELMCSILKSDRAGKVHFEDLVRLASDSKITIRHFFSGFSLAHLRRFFQNLPDYFYLGTDGYVELAKPDSLLSSHLHPASKIFEENKSNVYEFNILDLDVVSEKIKYFFRETEEFIEAMDFEKILECMKKCIEDFNAYFASCTSKQYNVAQIQQESLDLIRDGIKHAIDEKSACPSEGSTFRECSDEEMYIRPPTRTQFVAPNSKTSCAIRAVPLAAEKDLHPARRPKTLPKIREPRSRPVSVQEGMVRDPRLEDLGVRFFITVMKDINLPETSELLKLHLSKAPVKLRDYLRSTYSHKLSEFFVNYPKHFNVDGDWVSLNKNTF